MRLSLGMVYWTAERTRTRVSVEPVRLAGASESGSAADPLDDTDQQPAARRKQTKNLNRTRQIAHVISGQNYSCIVDRRLSPLRRFYRAV